MGNIDQLTSAEEAHPLDARANTPKLSVITICLNAAAHIEAALRSVREQSWPEIEHVVIDGGSTDGTLDIIARYRDGIDYLVSEPDGGLYNAMNKGIRAATGDVLFFLNADDVFCDADVARDAMRLFAENPDVDVVYGNQIYAVHNRHVLRRQPERITRVHLARTTVLHQTVFARARVFDATGGFSEHYRIVSDYEWMIKVFLSGRFNYRYIDREITVMATAGQSWTTNWQDERMDVMRRYFSRYEIFRYRKLHLWRKRLRKRLGWVGRMLRI